MEHWIEQPSKPTNLVLAWQAPDQVEDRTRWAVGQLSANGEASTFRYFSDEQLRALNLGRGIVELRSCGYAGYPAFDLRQNSSGVFATGVMDAFLRRLPPRSRSDFKDYLSHFRYREPGDLSPMSLLAITEARLPGDGFSLIDQLDPDAVACDLVFEVAGHRHYASARPHLDEGMALDLVPEPSNRFDPMAVRIEAAGVLIGYANRLQSKSITAWLSHRATACWLARLNGRADSPKAWAFVRMRSSTKALAA